MTGTSAIVELPGGLLCSQVTIGESSHEPAARVLVAGDLCLTGAAPDGSARGAHPWRPLQEFVAGHDLSLVNLECPLTRGGRPIAKVGPSLAGDPALAPLVRAGGFGAVTLANNHVMDRGPAGLTDTLAACHEAGLQTVGAGLDLAAATRPLMAEPVGLRVTVVNAAEREFSIATASSPGAAPLDAWATPQLVREARDAADVVLVVLHGGNELYPLPRPGLKAACRALVHAGAAAVLCHHTHVAGPLEVIDGAPVAYGLGNFLFPPRSPQAGTWYRGYLVSLDLGREGVRGLRLVPYAQGRAGASVEALPRAAAEAFLAELAGMAEVTADDARLRAAWLRFSAARRPYVLAAALGLTRVERRLLRAGVWPFWRLPRRRLPELLGTITCDSHRELLETLLGEETGP